MSEPRLGSHKALEGPNGLLAKIDAVTGDGPAEKVESELPYHETFLKHVLPGGESYFEESESYIAVDMSSSSNPGEHINEPYTDSKPRVYFGYSKTPSAGDAISEAIKLRRLQAQQSAGTPVLSAHTSDHERITYISGPEHLPKRRSPQEWLIEGWSGAAKGLLRVIGINL